MLANCFVLITGLLYINYMQIIIKPTGILGTLAMLFMLAVPLAAQGKNYGAPVTAYPALPAWQERAVHVLTNACRIDPTGFRAAYLNCDTILKPQNYRAATPLYWNVNLNRSSHDHSVDMATTCGMQHNSCNGTLWDTRLKSYYTPGWPIGENIATGQTTPLAVMQAWLLDANSSGIPAPDSSDDDGHRANIMDPRYKELGVGYAYNSTRQWYHFWTQDFAGGTSQYAYHPVASGSHHFPTGTTTMFLATFYSPTNAAPQEAALYIDGAKYTLTRWLGTNARGVYALTQTKAGQCRRYYLSFRDAGGTTWRYPETGVLVTSGEGSCQLVYEAPESVAIHDHISNNFTPSLSIIVGKTGIVMHWNQNGLRPISTTLLGLDGHIQHTWSWTQTCSPKLSAQFPACTPAGIYALRTIFADGKDQLERLVVVR
jgi:hypothetical protein